MELQGALANPALSYDEVMQYRTRWIRFYHRVTDVERLDARNREYIDSIFTSGTTMRIVDVRTGLYFNMRFFAQSGHDRTRHVDIVSVEQADTETFFRTVLDGYDSWGNRHTTWNWYKRPVLVIITDSNNPDDIGRAFIASIHGMPHEGGNIRMPGHSATGHVCFHVDNTETKSDWSRERHREALEEAYASGIMG